VSAAKQFAIDKDLFVRAFKLVKANAGSAGVDGKSLQDFERDLKRNLYKLWNRMSSGSYFPPPVKAVPIPKKGGGERILGVPTVADRVGQMVVKLVFEPKIEPHFLPDSYGYRPNKSALDAIGVTRKRCWKSNWLLEFDICGLFDNISHELLLKALGAGRDWVYLDLERPSDLAKLDDAESYLQLHKGKMVCLDEVQRHPDIFNLLRSLIDEDRRPGRFLLLG
jgi:retron-type reverse transcriptase